MFFILQSIWSSDLNTLQKDFSQEGANIIQIKEIALNICFFFELKKVKNVLNLFNYS